jgi:hypothetical protein
VGHVESFSWADFAARFDAAPSHCATPSPPEAWFHRFAGVPLDQSPPRWRGSVVERRYKSRLLRAVGAGGADAAAGGPNLDNRTYVAPPLARETGEWHFQQTVAHAYCEFLAVEDIDGSLCRGGRRTETVKELRSELGVLEEVVDDVELEADRRKLQMIAVRRSRRNLKWKVLMLRADRLWTLTTRGGISTREESWRLWGEFERYCSRRFVGFKSIVVHERHKSGAWHIHFLTNRFFDVNSMRLWWHRILTSTYVDSDGVVRPNPDRIQAPIRGEGSPGNVHVDRQCAGVKLAAYLGKYLGKGFVAEPGKRTKQFACSKGIAEPVRVRGRMHALMGEHVYRFSRRVAESGWTINGGIFEGVTPDGRRLLWVRCRSRGKVPLGTS